MIWAPSAAAAKTIDRDILRRQKPAASNVEVQRLQLPRRAS